MLVYILQWHSNTQYKTENHTLLFHTGQTNLTPLIMGEKRDFSTVLFFPWTFMMKLKWVYLVISDTFASKVAAVNDRYADSSIGNVTGSNAVNVFLGIGLAWTIAAIYHAVQGNSFEVDPGSLALSVTVFCIEAVLCCTVIVVRRKFGGELGGPFKLRIVTVVFFVFLWLFYIIMSALVAYCVIPSI